MASGMPRNFIEPSKPDFIVRRVHSEVHRRPCFFGGPGHGAAIMPYQRPSLTRSLLRRIRSLTHLLTRALPLTLIAVLLASSGQAATMINTVGSITSVGEHNSLVLDSSGNPVVSYYDKTNGDLKLAHCNDPNCAWGGDSIVTVDSTGDVGRYTSLALDGSGFPVVSYWDFTNRDLKLAHCNDVSCAGGGDSIVTVDSTGDVGSYTSLALDGLGFPVVSYYDATNEALKLAHCNDVNCDGTGDSVVTVDSSGWVAGSPRWRWTSPATR